MDNRIDDDANQGDSSPNKLFFEGVRGWQAAASRPKGSSEPSGSAGIGTSRRSIPHRTSSRNAAASRKSGRQYANRTFCRRCRGLVVGHPEPLRINPSQTVTILVRTLDTAYGLGVDRYSLCGKWGSRRRRSRAATIRESPTFGKRSERPHQQLPQRVADLTSRGPECWHSEERLRSTLPAPETRCLQIAQ